MAPPSATDWTEYVHFTTLGPDVGGGVTLQFVAAAGAAPGSSSTLEIDAVSVLALDPDTLFGDFNNDLSVDLADYTVWRNSLGGDPATLNGKGVPNATSVTSEDYELWKLNFGATSSGLALLGSSTAVPEPNSVGLMILLGSAGMYYLRCVTH